MAKTYDTTVADLADHFLQDEPNLNTKEGRHDLACTIQQAIEDWFEDQRRNYQPPDPPGWEGGFAENH